ncbi:phosphoenolpyruvate--protein phosphotransferase [Desulfatitalea alkaliphila]|uniref:Phosphoenolpyruvate-protein phosphotransferase n=1 Tax=Desulfatitalea alkaliphila TaxID=2929485 RepID=A0AA41UHZ0_9BACT|nr:phosphoenolpyruvate--protein phosphotransferase [Desulfatitalea alkaliphila]MCJ8499514.1 phosphoenolpyruvate--protein phosphotransferase [Desulfatitalea alkaliphila]
MTEQASREIVLHGIGGSPGICIGKAYLVDKDGVDVVPKYAVCQTKLEAEKKRFKVAVKKAIDELHAIIKETSAELRENAKILETHVVLLKDKMLYGRTIDTIDKEHINAEWALRKVVLAIKPLFEGMDDPYLRDRAEDVGNVCERIMKHLTGSAGVSIRTIDKRVILVAQDLSPAETSQIQLERVMGFVTDRGGRASHTSIIARSLEIPAVLGLEKATSTIRNDDIIVVDGTAGVVVVNPSEETLAQAETRKIEFENRRAFYARSGHLPAKTRDGIELTVMGNIEMPEEVVAVKDRGGDGIGLYRTEFQYLARQDFPSEDELYEHYKDVLDVMPGQPVTIRTLDINGDKAMAHNSDIEENPVLGLRAIRYCLKKPEVFITQLRAILRAAQHGQVRILVPMISKIEEVQQTRRLLEKAAESLKKEGFRHQRRVPLGIMIEVPSAAIMADALAREVDFFSIGTNDLIQYTMAIDRGNRHVAYLYSPLHPAVLRLLKHVTEAGARHNVPVFMCGEMAGESIYVPILLGLGIKELSVNAQAIPLIKSAVRAVDVEQARQFVDRLLQQTTIAQIEKLLETTYGDLKNNHHHIWER